VSQRYTLEIHDEGEPGYHLWGEVRELPGCFFSGRDNAELMDAATEAIGLYLSEPGQPVAVTLEPEPGSVTEQPVMARTA
jgi:predicted RNase H-like HicB family nuclease